MPGRRSSSGQQRLEEVAVALRKAGDGGLRRKFLRRIRTAVKPTLPKPGREALRTLPRRGGFARLVADTPMVARSSLTPGRVRVRIQAAGRDMRRLRAVDAGKLRHPVWGHRDRWATQAVKPGFFTRPIEQDVPRIRGEVGYAADDIAREIEEI